MADGLITAPAPKVVTEELKSELVPSLRLRTAVTVVQVTRSNGATRKPAQVRNVGCLLLVCFYTT